MRCPGRSFLLEHKASRYYSEGDKHVSRSVAYPISSPTLSTLCNHNDPRFFVALRFLALFAISAAIGIGLQLA